MRALQDRTSDPNIANNAFEIHACDHLATPGCAWYCEGVSRLKEFCILRVSAVLTPTCQCELASSVFGWGRSCPKLWQMFGFMTRLLQLAQWLALFQRVALGVLAPWQRHGAWYQEKLRSTKPMRRVVFGDSRPRCFFRGFISAVVPAVVQPGILFG